MSYEGKGVGSRKLHRRDAENAEIAQRRNKRVSQQPYYFSVPLCVLCVSAVNIRFRSPS